MDSDVILPPGLTRIWQFSLQITHFHQIDPINDMFDQRYVNKLDWNNFWDSLKKKNCFVDSKNVDLWRILGLQNDPTLIIFTKNDLFWPNWDH